MKVIVNADDLGENQEINRAIFETIALEKVTSATIMANGNAVDECLETCRKFPRCSFGVHLNCTDYRPLSGHPALAPILDDNGNMSRSRLTAARRTPSLLRALYAEFSCQVERVQAGGIAISHLDSHHHVHTQPAIFLVVKKLQWRYGIRRIRRSMNFYPPSVRPSLVKRWAKNFYHAALVADRTAAPRLCCDFRSFYSYLMAGAAPRAESIELMTHPGARSDMYEHETGALKTDWLPLLQKQVPSARLVSYMDL